MFFQFSLFKVSIFPWAIIIEKLFLTKMRRWKRYLSNLELSNLYFWLYSSEYFKYFFNIHLQSLFCISLETHEIFEIKKVNQRISLSQIFLFSLVFAFSFAKAQSCSQTSPCVISICNDLQNIILNNNKVYYILTNNIVIPFIFSF